MVQSSQEDWAGLWVWMLSAILPAGKTAILTVSTVSLAQLQIESNLQRMLWDVLHVPKLLKVFGITIAVYKILTTLHSQEPVNQPSAYSLER